MDAIRIGLIGLGRHGMRYARHLLQDIPEARLVAVSRRNVEEGTRFGTDHGVRFYPDYRELVTDPAVDAVVVATPPSLSRLICHEAVRARKPLLIEKPLALTGADARDMVLAAQSGDVALMTAHTLRFEAAVRGLKSELPSVGVRQYLALTSRVETRRQRRRDPAEYGGRGVLLEVGIHLLDLVRFLTEEEVTEVRCEIERPERGSPESRALASLQTSGGLSCILDISRVTSVRVGRAEWVGSDGEILADWVRHRVDRLFPEDRVEARTVEERATIVDTLRAFVSAIAQRGPMPITGLDGQRAVEIADACYESAATGQPVKPGP